MCNCFSKNLGLGEGSALPVGVPIPWPSATPPTGWLKCNGAAFTTSQYPKLAQAYPALILPDLRGEFIRGWDDSRGVDSGRSLLSAQGDAIRNITGRVDNAVTSAKNSYLGAMQYQGSSYISVQSGGVNVDAMNISFDASRIVPTGLAPIFPYTFYHLTHYWFAAADIPVANDTPVHYADAIRCNVRRPPQGSLPLLTRRVSA